MTWYHWYPKVQLESGVKPALGVGREVEHNHGSERCAYTTQLLRRSSMCILFISEELQFSSLVSAWVE